MIGLKMVSVISTIRVVSLVNQVSVILVNLMSLSLKLIRSLMVIMDSAILTKLRVKIKKKDSAILIK